jgi:predicted ATP-grasp superfamily ATP-dependent carboligase
MEWERSAASGATSARPGALLSVHDSAPAGKRTALDILLLDAEYRQTLAALRAYTRMGLSVGVVACAGEASGAPAFASRYARVRAIAPEFATNPNGYVDAILELLELYPARMTLPAHDGAIEALRPRRAEVERITAFPLASEAALDIAISKPRTLEVAEDVGVPIPRSLPVTTLDEARAAFRAFGSPTVLKPVQSWAENETGGTRLSVNAVLTEKDAEREARYILESGGQAVAQEFLPGWREAVSVFYADGEILARFAQRSYREFPVLGGVSTLCESIAPAPELVEPAERLVRAIGLEGCSMVEFRRDRAGNPVLMEINARPAGSLALAVRCGVNFPRLLYNWAMGLPLQAVEGYRVGKRLRWLSGDIWNLNQTLDHQGQPDVPPRGRAIRTFFTDFALRPSKLDFVSARDMRPALVEFRHVVVRPLLRKARKSTH